MIDLLENEISDLQGSVAIVGSSEFTEGHVAALQYELEQYRVDCLMESYMNVGKNYHEMCRDVERLLIMASEYITYRLELESGVKPKEKLTLVPIRKFQASINRVRQRYNIAGIKVLDDLRIVNASIRDRQGHVVKCGLCGSKYLRGDVTTRFDYAGQAFRACEGCVVQWDLSDES